MADYPACRDLLAIAADMAHTCFDARCTAGRCVELDVLVWANGGVTWNLKDITPLPKEL